MATSLLPKRYAVAAAKYTGMLADAQGYYHAAYYNPQSKVYSRGSQTSQLMPLLVGAVPTELIPTIGAALTADIRAYGDHFDLGIVGTTFIFDVLAGMLGEGELAIQVLLKDDYPSFGYMIANNATTLWEAWEGTPTSQVSSRNHIMFGGGIGTWGYRGLAGLDTIASPPNVSFEEVPVNWFRNHPTKASGMFDVRVRACVFVYVR
jgi:alpha-L-rhamnosidase